MGPYRCMQTSAVLPLILHYGKFSHIYIINVIIKLIIKLYNMHLSSYPPPPPPRSVEKLKIVLHETGPWYRNVGGCCHIIWYLYEFRTGDTPRDFIFNKDRFWGQWVTRDFMSKDCLEISFTGSGVGIQGLLAGFPPLEGQSWFSFFTRQCTSTTKGTPGGGGGGGGGREQHSLR